MGVRFSLAALGNVLIGVDKVGDMCIKDMSATFKTVFNVTIETLLTTLHVN